MFLCVISLIPNFYGGTIKGFIFGNKLYAHAPPIISGEKSSKLTKRKLIFIDNDRCFCIETTVTDLTSEHTATRNPLIAVF